MEHMTLDDAAAMLRDHAEALRLSGDRAGMARALACAAACANHGPRAADRALAVRLRPKNGDRHPTQRNLVWRDLAGTWVPLADSHLVGDGRSPSRSPAISRAA